MAGQPAMSATLLPQTTTAAVLFETGKPLELVELQLPEPAPGELLVEINYTGVCHSQLNEARGRKGPDRFLPHAMGHEGSGRVLATGPGVTKVAPGDAVVLTWIKASGSDIPSRRYPSSRGPINSGAIATFMRHTITCESRVVRLPQGMPLREGALLGCAVPTGGGMVMHAVRERRGISVAVFGVGGVGTAAIAVAATLGASPLIAVDVVAHKLETALRLGASHGLNPKTDDVLAQIHSLTGNRGVDLAIEAAGLPHVMEMAFAATRYGGGTCVLAGNVAHGEVISIDPYDLIRGRQIRGSWGGETDPDADIQRYAELALGGKLNLSAMVTAEYPLSAINEALDDLEAGRVVRAMVVP
jgi:S-(hydroxymethyl)glutathione dehydrogenase / alcohol dehydrogenase